MLSDAIVKANTGVPAKSSLRMEGSSKAAGKSVRTPLTAERISSSASCTGFSMRNSQEIKTEPSCTLV